MIAVEHVTKRYGAHTAVEDASFAIGAGEVVGFLGPNGAGKSTLLKLMSTWLLPTSGRIRIDGHDTLAEPLAVRRSLGYLTEHNALWDGMRVDRFLRFMGRARGLSGRRLEERTAWVVQACTLQDVLRKRLHECSKGFRQRIGVAAALIHDPRVILLDEPTHGLDPLQVVAFREFIRSLAPGRAVLFSSHIVSEVLSISDRVLVIQQGRLIADTPVAEIKARARSSGQDVEQVVLDIVRQAAGGAATGGAAAAAAGAAR
ncbi:MAG TPA: ATP-binding cassette domain-containing protein [Planctomycetota bacterium]|nr:ATP-binding cassette domain-containing protein [Planctomycetota bacterium]